MPGACRRRLSGRRRLWGPLWRWQASPLLQTLSTSVGYGLMGTVSLLTLCHGTQNNP